MNNPILLTDSYKASHAKQYIQCTAKRAGTTTIHSYFSCRKSKDFNEVVFFGIKPILQKLKTIITNEMIEEARSYFEEHMHYFDDEGWKHIVDHCEGKLPLNIWHVPEGSICKIGEPLIVVENTDPKCFWLTNYVETLLVQVWAPITVATNSYHLKKDILSALEMTGNVINIDYKMHDFGVRGVSSMETAAITGTAHLTQFWGTDNVPALVLTRSVYDENMAGFSIPATEHSTVTAWGDEPLDELKMFANLLKIYEDKMFACVCDSYNIYQFIINILGHKSIKTKILSRLAPVVIRPDSGDPPTVVIDVLNALESVFGSELNEKGYRELPRVVRVIQGDGIDAKMCTKVMLAMVQKGWSINNIGFGSGGGLLQKFNRDTLGCAFKASAVELDGEWKDIYKSPIDAPNKKSLKGRCDTTKMVLGYTWDHLNVTKVTWAEIKERCALQYDKAPSFLETCKRHGFDTDKQIIAPPRYDGAGRPMIRKRPLGYCQKVNRRLKKFRSKEFREYKVEF